MNEGLRRAGFAVAAGIPALALGGFAAYGVHEWWLIRTHQIVIVPAPQKGQSSVPELPATNVLLFALAAAALAGLFAYAGLRRSKLALAGGYLVLVLLVVLPRIVRAL